MNNTFINYVDKLNYNICVAAKTVSMIDKFANNAT